MGEKVDFDSHWNFDEPAESEEKFRELLQSTELISDPDYLAQLRTQLARTLGLQRKFEEAHRILDQVELILPDDSTTGRVRYLLERGRTHNSAGETEQARPLFLQAWSLGREMALDFYAVDAAHMLGILEKGQESLNWNLKAVGHAEASEQSQARGWLGSLYNNIGWTYHDMAEYEKALHAFQSALEYREERGEGSNIRIARWCIARCLRSLGRLEEAYDIQTGLLREAAENDETAGYTQEELGELLLALNRPEEAKPFFASAFEGLSKDIWLQANEPERLERLERLGS